MAIMDPQQEILELLRAIRETQLESRQTQLRVIRKTRIFAIILLAIMLAYTIWAIVATR